MLYSKGGTPKKVGTLGFPHRRQESRSKPHCVGADFWAGDPTKQFSVKKKGFSMKRGEGFGERGVGKDFYRKGNSVKRSGPFSEPPGSEN